MEKIISKECKKHGLTDFVLRENKRYRCRKCSVDSVNKRRRKIKEMAINHKGGECSLCGYNKCNAALEFHHTGMIKKEFNFSKVNVSWERVKVELDKCILVCANCHREIHDSLA